MATASTRASAGPKAKSSPVPDEWWPAVNRWLNRMGYRFVLRKLTYPSAVKPGGSLAFTSWWENKGVAPCYRPFRLAFRLAARQGNRILLTGADLPSWLPGDNLYDHTVEIPADTPPGSYDLQIGILDPRFDEPAIQLAIEDRRADGWYDLGKITVRP
jgi:hypothetical protein